MSEVATLRTKSTSNFNSAAMVPQTMEQAMSLAKLMSQGSLVPSHLQGKPADTLMVIELAMRLGMSPFAVAQCTSVIQGKIMLEGKLVGAALNASGLLASRMQYEFSGEGDTRQVVASARIHGEAKPASVTVELAKVKTTNGMWVKQPDQQLVYSANRVWARRYAPEVMLGVYSEDEFEVTPQEQRAEAGVTIDGDHTESPQFMIATNRGGKAYSSVGEWKAGWDRAVKNYVDANAPDKLQALRDMNKGPLAQMADVDPAAHEAVQNLIAEALGEAPYDGAA